MWQVAAVDGQVQRVGRICYVDDLVPVVMCIVTCAPLLFLLPLSDGPNNIPAVKIEVLNGRSIRGRKTTRRLIGGSRM